jgi:hypothetical protein
LHGKFTHQTLIRRRQHMHTLEIANRHIPNHLIHDYLSTSASIDQSYHTQHTHTRTSYSRVLEALYKPPFLLFQNTCPFRDDGSPDPGPRWSLTAAVAVLRNQENGQRPIIGKAEESLGSGHHLHFSFAFPAVAGLRNWARLLLRLPEQNACWLAKATRREEKETRRGGIHMHGIIIITRVSENLDHIHAMGNIMDGTFAYQFLSLLPTARQYRMYCLP